MIFRITPVDTVKRRAVGVQAGKGALNSASGSDDGGTWYAGMRPSGAYSPQETRKTKKRVNSRAKLTTLRGRNRGIVDENR